MGYSDGDGAIAVELRAHCGDEGRGKGGRPKESEPEIVWAKERSMSSSATVS
jgi:hypothetical protein